jgi:hypothetical protein
MTPGTWHVNGIDSRRRRITGDETSTGWDKLQINANNRTVATVYRAEDARLIATAPRLLDTLQAILPSLSGRDAEWAREAIASATGKGVS